MESKDADPPEILDQRLASLTAASRQAFLLTAMEGFSGSEAAKILGLADDEFAAAQERAREEIAAQVRTGVIIIEDEFFIAAHVEEIVESLGHKVIASVPTKDEAVAAARTNQPGLILADIQLADGDDGVDTVNTILESKRVPVIFITAYPDRLLTGLKPEPTFLIEKPFTRKNVSATISQALFFQTDASAGDDVKRHIGKIVSG